MKLTTLLSTVTFVVLFSTNVAAKNPYADIPPEYHLTNMASLVDSLRKIAVITRQIPNHPYMTFDPTKPVKGRQEDKEE